MAGNSLCKHAASLRYLKIRSRTGRPESGRPIDERPCVGESGNAVVGPWEDRKGHSGLGVACPVDGPIHTLKRRILRRDSSLCNLRRTLARRIVRSPPGSRPEDRDGDRTGRAEEQVMKRSVTCRSGHGPLMARARSGCPCRADPIESRFTVRGRRSTLGAFPAGTRHPAGGGRARGGVPAPRLYIPRQRVPSRRPHQETLVDVPPPACLVLDFASVSGVEVSAVNAWKPPSRSPAELPS